MTKRKIYDVFDTVIRVQSEPNEKILRDITIINTDGFLPQKIVLGTTEIAKLMEILNQYEYKSPFIWEKEQQ